MPQANQLLPFSTQTTASAGSVVSQPVENNSNSGEGDKFSSLLKSNIAQTETTNSPSGQKPQPGNTVSVESQNLPQDGKPLPVSAGFYILDKGGLVAGLNLQAGNHLVQSNQTNQVDTDSDVLSEVLAEAETATENPLGNTVGTETTEQNTVKEFDEAGVLATLESKTTAPEVNTNTQTSVESAKDVSSRSALPEASVVGQQKAVESIIKHSATTGDGDTEIESLPGNGREVSARLAALMQKEGNTASSNRQITEEASQESLDVDKLMQEMNDGKKLLDSDQGKATMFRSTANALGANIGNELVQNLNQSQNPTNLSGFQAVGVQPAQLNSASTVTQTPVIDMPLKQQGWDEAMGQRVVWQINQKIQSADIRLNPPHLGPLEVRINMTEEGASVTFSSQHGAVRETVEAALPKLREMLEEQGINLANADVSEQSVAQQEYRGETGEDNESSNMTSRQDTDDEGQAASSIISVSEGVLDLFA